ncbi:MAG: prolipoprotein diacylglyceryl transferase [Bacillota bacterium]|nr:prolipoprotein diacylglyceryl transferase [Bacillota bacterium]
MEHYMEQYGVSFPGLGLNFGYFSPYVFGTPIRWYGVLIATGFLLAALYTLKRVKEFRLTEDNFLDAMIIVTPIAIICARLFYVLFDLQDYVKNPIRILYIWEGGLAIYGGIIGAIVSAWIFCKIRKINPLNLLDLTALGLLIGQAVGRWGNFFNREVFGRETDSFFRMVLTNPSDTSLRLSVHPLFLYESLWNILGFGLLHYKSKNRKFSGEIILLYLAWYGLGRSIMEGMRDPSYILTLFGTRFPIDRFIAVLSIAAALSILIYKYRKLKTKSQEGPDIGDDN